MSSAAQNQFDLRGRRAVVTGSSSGIGRAIALNLARSGAEVVVHYARSQNEAERTAELARESGAAVSVIQADLANNHECSHLVDKVWSRLGGCDIWVNNAGADTLTGDIAKQPFQFKLEQLWSVDVRATVILSRAVAARMQPSGGVILNMGWDQAETGMEGDSGQLFAVAKGAIMAFTKSLSLTAAPHVRVNCLAPGWIRTAWGEQASQSWQERVMNETPLGRWGTPEDVARVACFLCSDAASFLTGQIIRVNGGAVRC